MSQQSMPSDDLKVKFLINEHGYYEGIAHALVEAKGCCVFCGENILKTRLGYSSLVMDHLLPKAIFPELEREIRNHVLSCSSCNSMKGNHDPLLEGESPKEMVEKNRDELIRRVQILLAEKILQREEEWKSIRDKILNDS